MNIRQLLRCGDVVSPTAVQTESVETETPKFEHVTLAENEDPTKYELSDADADYLLERLMEFGDKYFKAEGLLMTHDIIGDLLYHIPVGFVQASKRVKELDLPDVMDPIMSLYPMFTVSTVGDVYYEYLAKIRILLSEENGFFDPGNPWNSKSDASNDEEDPTEEDATDYEPEGEPDFEVVRSYDPDDNDDEEE